MFHPFAIDMYFIIYKGFLFNVDFLCMIITNGLNRVLRTTASPRKIDYRLKARRKARFVVKKIAGMQISPMGCP
jgi:hypothetical protein